MPNDTTTVEVPREVERVFADIADQYSEQEDDDFQVINDMDVLAPRLLLKYFRAIRTATRSAIALSAAPASPIALEVVNRWYVGTMNDAVFIIDTPPRPAPVDHLTEGDPNTHVISALGAGTPETVKLAEEIVAAHNSELSRLRAELAEAKAEVIGWRELFPAMFLNEGESHLNYIRLMQKHHDENDALIAAQLSTAEKQLAEAMAWLAKAADMLNGLPQERAMNLGCQITDYRALASTPSKKGE